MHLPYLMLAWLLFQSSEPVTNPYIELFVLPLLSILGGLAASAMGLYFLREKRKAEVLKDHADTVKIFTEAAENITDMSARHVERIVKENLRLRKLLVSIWNALEKNRAQLELVGVDPEALPTKEEMVEIRGIVADGNGEIITEEHKDS